MKQFPLKDKILFIRLRLLGDIIFTIPVISVFRVYFPSIKIYYVVEEQYKDIAELIPGIHQLLVIPRKMSLREMWGFRKKIRKFGIDVVVDFHSGPKSAQLTRITGAKIRIGYRTPNRNWAYNHLTSRKFEGSYTHSVYNQAKLMEHLGISLPQESLPPYPKVSIKKEQISESVMKIVRKEKKVIIHIGAGNSFRDWGFENFLHLIQRLKNIGVNVIIVGNGSKEINRGAELEFHLKIDNMAGKLSLVELIYLISQSQVYVGADSGPLHLASLTSTPLVALYGPNIPEISGPWRKKKVTIIKIPMACQPCNQKRCIYDIIPCMTKITTDDVYEAIFRYLQ